MRYFFFYTALLMFIALIVQQVIITKQDSDIKRLEILYLSALENCK